MQRAYTYMRGFTLVEILVSIAVIGILSTIVFMSVQSARGKAEDTKRKSDLTALAVALKLYKEDFGEYPAPGCTAFWGKGGGSGQQYASPGPADATVHWYIAPECDEYIDNTNDFVPDYIPALPQDPDEDKEGAGYMYTAWDVNGVGKFTEYKLIAHNSASREVDYTEEFGRCAASCIGTLDCHGETWTYEPSFAVYTPAMACE